MQISYEQVRQLYYQNSQFGFYPCWVGRSLGSHRRWGWGSARLIITDKQLQRVVQLNRSPHCTSGHEDRVTPHHFYATPVAHSFQRVW